MKYVIFGDESTIPGMRALLGGAVTRTVVASNRAAAVAQFASTAMVQPARSSPLYPAFVAELAGAAPDALICFSYSMILGADLLDIPAKGAINVHGGLLPHYRGANVLNWAIIEDARETGVTAHFMTPGIDDGDIVYQEATPIMEEDTAATLKARLDKMGLDLVRKIDLDLRAGRDLPRRRQDPAQVRYFPRRLPEDGRIDWKAMSDRQIFNLVRALARPWPGAFFEDSTGRRIVIDDYCTLAEIARLRAQHG